MAIPPSIHLPLYITTEKPTSKIPSFDEGAMSSTNKIVAFAIMIIASVGSFLVLPFEGAIIATLVSIFLPFLDCSLRLPLIGCNNHSEHIQNAVLYPRAETPRWLHTASQLNPSFQRNHPVRHQGRRVNVGGGHHSSQFSIHKSGPPIHPSVEAIRSLRHELVEVTNVYPNPNRRRVPVGRRRNETF